MINKIKKKQSKTNPSHWLSIKPKEYVKSQITFVDKKIKLFSNIFFILNIMIFIAILGNSVLYTLIYSRLFYNDVPEWFLPTTAMTASFTTLATLLINFFAIKTNLNVFKSQKQKLETATIEYNNDLNDKFVGKRARYNLFLKVAGIMGNNFVKEKL